METLIQGETEIDVVGPFNDERQESNADEVEVNFLGNGDGDQDISDNEEARETAVFS